jgi:hypothetical protein
MWPCTAPAARAGLAVLHPIVDVAKLADVMVFVKLLPETDRNNLVKITARASKGNCRME